MADGDAQGATHRRQALAITGLLAVTAAWGLTFILVKWTVAEVDVYYFLLLRFTAALLLLAAIFHRRMGRIRGDTVLASLALSALMFTVYTTQTEGLRITTASNSALITGLYMVLIPIFSLIYPGRKPGALAIAGIVVAVPGLWLLTSGSLNGLNSGDLLTLICACACAWHIILTGRFASRHNIIQLVIFQFLFVAVMSGIAMVIKGAAPTSLPPIGWLTVIVTAVFATAMAFTIQTWAQRVIDPTRTGIIFAMEAVFGALFGWWLGGETMAPIAFAGACLMVAGMGISEIRPLAKYAIDKIVG